MILCLQFTLEPAIFVPFNGFPLGEVKPIGRDEKLRRILDNLDKQHDAVRRNMAALALMEKERILEELKDRLKEEQLEGVESEWVRVGEEEEDEILRRMKMTRDDVAGPGVYDEENWKLAWAGAGSGSGGMEDVQMGGMSTPRARATQLREEANLKLRELVVNTEEEIKAYNAHAESTCEFYRKALQRGADREGFGGETSDAERNGTTQAATGGGGILVNKGDEIRVDREALAVMDVDVEQKSTGNIVDASKDPRRR